MPLRKVSSVTERAGINYLRNLVEANNSIFKEMNQQHDYGHDAFVLLVEGEQVLPKEVKFVRTDLPGISLRSTDLTDVCFHDCVLADCKFEWAHLIGTRFEKLGNDALRGAQFGALEHFEYIYNDNQLIEDRDQMRKWALEHTGIVAEQADPCATAFQFRTVFRKFVHEDGSGRRDQLP